MKTNKQLHPEKFWFFKTPSNLKAFIYFFFLFLTALPLPCEVYANVCLSTADLGEGERGDVTPDLQCFPKDAANVLLAHLPGKPHNPADGQRRCYVQIDSYRMYICNEGPPASYATPPPKL